MKKHLLIALTTALVATTAICHAASGKILDAEEAIAEKFGQGAMYKQLTPMMTSEMQKEVNEAKYNELQTNIAKNLGKFTTFRMREYTRFDDADVLTYQIVTEKVPAAQLRFVFKVVGQKPLLDDAVIEVMVPNQPGAQAPKK